MIPDEISHKIIFYLTNTPEDQPPFSKFFDDIIRPRLIMTKIGKYVYSDRNYHLTYIITLGSYIITLATAMNPLVKLESITFYEPHILTNNTSSNL